MLKKTFLNKIKEQLLTQKKEILAHTQQEREVDTEGDEVDVIQAAILAEMSNRLINRAAQKIKQIDDALARIEKKTYGLCQDCEEPIPEKRLFLNPHFQTCVSCAEDREADSKLQKRI
jgi:DnaK suppressor protein